MRIFKHRQFQQWMKGEDVTDGMLKEAVAEMVVGLRDVSLGSGLYKKRIAAPGKGKSGGYRTLIAFKSAFRAFFIYGFSKNEKANITVNEKCVYRRLSRILLEADESTLNTMLHIGSLIEVI